MQTSMRADAKIANILCNVLTALTFFSQLVNEQTPSLYLIKYLHTAASWHPFIHRVSAAGITSEPIVSDDAYISQ